MSTGKARELRKNPTEAERKLWKHLRLRQIGGHKFRRQQQIGLYIVDFVCLEKKLVIEVDGGQHSEQLDYDEQRTTWLEAQGFRVLRFWNNEVLTQVEVVKEVIVRALGCDSNVVLTPSPLSGGRLGWGEKKKNNTPHPNPPPQGGRECKEKREPDQLPRIIKSLIRKSGAITFAKFMELALYHLQYGYYSGGNAKVGKDGDYYTSPHAHPAFGETIGRFVCQAYRAVNSPDFRVVEMGAGKGFLALDILDSIKRNDPRLYDRIGYLIVELSPQLREEGKSILREHSHKIKWVDSVSRMRPQSVSGVILSNELVDSFPFHRAKFRDGRLFEIFVALKDDEFIEISDKPSSSDIEEYFKGYDLEFEDEQEVEVNLQSREWLNRVEHALAKGFILTIDYGCPASELFSPIRMKGTFRCFYKHSINESPYINIGEQDITAHVDFSNLIRVGKSLGLSTIKHTTQGQFLIDWGILDVMEKYSGEDKSQNISAEKSRMAIKNLFLPELMGDRFKVLVQGKNLEGEISNFYPESPFRLK